MRKLLKDEKGAALLLVLFIIIVFTMIGMAVMSASIGGAVRSQTKQKDVQSVHLAEKALNEAVAMIQGMLAGQTTINLDLLPEQLGAVILEINKSNEVSTDYDKQYGDKQSSVTTNATLVIQAKKPPIINVSVESQIQGVTRKLEQDLIVNSYPDVLKYAAGSEDGNFVINGSPYFLGENSNGGGIYAGKQLLIKNEAEYFYESEAVKKEETRFPSLEGTAYVQSLSNIQYCAVPNCTSYGPIKEISGDSDSKDAKFILGDMSETQIKSNKDFIGINMEESFIDKLTEAVGGVASDREYIEANYKTPAFYSTYLISKVDHYSPSELTGFEDQPAIDTHDAAETNYITYVREGLGDGSVLHRGNLNLNNSGKYPNLLFTSAGKNYREDRNGDGYSQSNWFIVDGDLNITNTSLTSAIQVRANILVTGDVNIKGRVEMDATIFALGSTIIEDASIVGLNNKELVLMSKGSILITRVNTNGEGPYPVGQGPFKDIQDEFERAFGENAPTGGNIQRLDAFFYTDSTAELYGVGSIFWIRGGFFSKGNLTINAIRGDAKVEDDYIHGEEGQSLIEGERARFIISYNNDMFDDQSAALPRVKTVQLIRGKKKMIN